MAKLKVKYICQECGYEAHKWLGRCPSCNEWNSFVEEVSDRSVKTPNINIEAKIEKIVDIETDEESRTSTGLEELDRVLGGGLVKGSLILVGGDPGIGKSTLLIQVANNISRMGLKVLYVSAEESARQIKLRSDRLSVQAKELYLLSETNMDIVTNAIDNLNPDLLIIDSIQTVYNPSLESAPGSVSQVRETTAILMKLAKTRDMATFIIGHVTKEGVHSRTKSS